MGRADWHLRANAFVIIYLLAALLSGVIQRTREGGEPAWLTVHLLLLGAVTNAIVVWSDHFVSALLWARSRNRFRQIMLVSLLNLGIVGVLLSVSFHMRFPVILSATLIGGVITYYVAGISRLLRQSLNKGFKGVIAYYQWAALMILVGMTLGVIDSFKTDENVWQARITLAHLHANLLGWVGLTIIGTLVTLWPTVLRTQIHEWAINGAKLGLKILLVGIFGSVVGSLINQSTLLSISVAIYLLGAAVALAPAGLLLRRRTPDRSGSWMLLSGVIGLAILLISEISLVLEYRKSEKILSSIETHLILIFTLWLLPILLGALTHLLPVVLGKGPASTRALESTLNFGWHWRILLFPLSSAFQFLPAKFHIVGLILAAIALGMFLTLAIVAMRKSRTNITLS